MAPSLTSSGQGQRKVSKEKYSGQPLSSSKLNNEEEQPSQKKRNHNENSSKHSIESQRLFVKGLSSEPEAKPMVVNGKAFAITKERLDSGPTSSGQDNSLSPVAEEFVEGYNTPPTPGASGSEESSPEAAVVKDSEGDGTSSTTPVKGTRKMHNRGVTVKKSPNKKKSSQGTSIDSYKERWRDPQQLRKQEFKKIFLGGRDNLIKLKPIRSPRKKTSMRSEARARFSEVEQSPSSTKKMKFKEEEDQRISWENMDQAKKIPSTQDNPSEPKQQWYTDQKDWNSRNKNAGRRTPRSSPTHGLSTFTNAKSVARKSATSVSGESLPLHKKKTSKLPPKEELQRLTKNGNSENSKPLTTRNGKLPASSQLHPGLGLNEKQKSEIRTSRQKTLKQMAQSRTKPTSSGNYPVANFWFFCENGSIS